MVRSFFLLLMLVSMAKADEPPQAVITTPVQEVNIAPMITGVGTFTPYNDVTLKAETSGRIEHVHFKEGDRAKPNQLLFSLYNKEQEAKVKRAEANLKMSTNILHRKQKLIEKEFTSPQDLEQAETHVEADQADLALAKEGLAKTEIRAPFEGVLSGRTVSKGAYVSEGDELVRIQDITPIRLTFQIPEKDIPLIKIGEKITATTDVYPNRAFEGKIEAVEPSVNEGTRSVSVYSAFENKEEHLIPGLYGRAQIPTASQKAHSLFIPEQALVVRPDGMYVFKKVEDKAVLTKITLGKRASDHAEVLSGLKKGDHIVLEGQDKIQDGSPITATCKM